MAAFRASRGCNPQALRGERWRTAFPGSPARGPVGTFCFASADLVRFWPGWHGGGEDLVVLEGAVSTRR